MIATTGEFKGYDVNTFYFYDSTGRSAVELETNAPDNQCIDKITFMREVRAKREEFLKMFREAGARQDTYGNQTAMQPVPENYSPSQEYANEDIPF